MGLFRGFVICLASTAIAAAQPKPSAPVLVGATEVARYAAPGGFIDDAVGADDQRLAYVVADTASKAELHVVGLGKPDPGSEVVIDIAPVTLHPVGLTLVGPRALVVGAGEDGAQIAAMIELTAKSKTKPAGTVVYKLGPAAHISLITRDGKRVIAVHRAAAQKGGTRHEVELVALETGKRIAAPHALELDATGGTPLDFHVNHWSDGMTRAHGIKGGEWNKKDDQRSPDVEATYDMVTGKFVEQTKIGDLFEQRKRYQQIADAGGGSLDFVRVGDKGLEQWRAGKPHPLELDQPFTAYEPKSLATVMAGDGTGWFALKVDPVNPEAVARKKADAEYLDIFKLGSDGKAVRKARVLATGVRHRFGIAGDKFWLLERNNGFERGGKSIAVYAFS